MLKCTVLFLFAIHVFVNANCYAEEECSISFLDVAIDLIKRTKNHISEGKVHKECPEIQAIDCADWYGRGYNKSGVYKIHPMNRLTFNKSLSVFCDMDTDGGGWTVIQRRGNFGKPDDYFNKDWENYKHGFGDIDRDFWLGNDNIFALTNQKPYSIRFDLQDIDFEQAYATYFDFWIDDESNKYMLHIAGYSGNAGDSMIYHDSKNFSTKDRKNDSSKTSCAVNYKSAWWHGSCYYAQLNGLYNVKKHGIVWHHWRNSSLPSLTWTEMKIRPKNFPLFFPSEEVKENDFSG